MYKMTSMRISSLSCMTHPKFFQPSRHQICQDDMVGFLIPVYNPNFEYLIKCDISCKLSKCLAENRFSNEMSSGQVEGNDVNSTWKTSTLFQAWWRNKLRAFFPQEHNTPRVQHDMVHRTSQESVFTGVSEVAIKNNSEWYSQKISFHFFIWALIRSFLF